MIELVFCLKIFFNIDNIELLEHIHFVLFGSSSFSSLSEEKRTWNGILSGSISRCLNSEGNTIES